MVNIQKRGGGMKWKKGQKKIDVNESKKKDSST